MAFEYFTEAELRALPQVSDTVVYTTARASAAADYVVGVIERVCLTSFISRTVTGEVHDGGTYAIALNKPHVLSVTSATENGDAVTDTLRVQDGVVRRFSSASSYSPGFWAAGTGNVAVTYAAGYSSTVPADLKEAALKACRAHLLATNSNSASVMDERRTAMNTELGTVQFVVAGENRPFGYPEIDAVIIGWRDRVNNYGFA